MNREVKAHGVSVDILELFDDLILIQEIISKNIYLITYNCIDPHDNIGYNSKCEEDSNVISLKGWSRWQGRKKQPKKKPLLKR